VSACIFSKKVLGFLRGKTCKAGEGMLQEEVKNCCSHHMGVTLGTALPSCSTCDVGIFLSTIKSIKEEASAERQQEPRARRALPRS